MESQSDHNIHTACDLHCSSGLAGFCNCNRRLSLDDNPRDVTANSGSLVYQDQDLQSWVGTRFNSEYFFLHDQVFVLAHGEGGVERRWLPGTFWSLWLLLFHDVLLSSVSVCCLRWERKAQWRRRSVCATTSPCTAAPSLWCPTTWTYPAQRSCLPPCRRTTWCWHCCVPSSASTWSLCCGPATLTAGHARRSVGRLYYQLWLCTNSNQELISLKKKMCIYCEFSPDKTTAIFLFRLQFNTNGEKCFFIRGRWLCWRTITQALFTTIWSVSKLAIARMLGPLQM